MRLAGYWLLAGLYFAAPLTSSLLQVPTDFAYRLLPWREMAPQPVVPGNELLSDVLVQTIPFRALVRDRLLRLEPPLWASETGTGQPLLGNAQSAPFSPLGLTALPLPAVRALPVMAALRLFLSLLLTDALLAALGAGRAGALLGALAFSFSVYSICWAYHPHGMAMGWLPGVILGLLLVRRGERGGVAGLVACATAMALSGHPETLAHTALAAAGITAGLLAVPAAVSRRRFLARVALAAAITAGLAAPVLLPVVEALPEAMRYIMLARSPGALQPPPFAPATLQVLVDPLAAGDVSPLAADERVGCRRGSAGCIMRAMLSVALCLVVLASAAFVFPGAPRSSSESTPGVGQATRSTDSTADRITMSVSNDLVLTLPPTLEYVPDEHISFLPAPRPGFYNVLVAGDNRVGGQTYGDAFVLETSNFRKFIMAPGYGNADHGRSIFWSPHKPTDPCNYKGVTHFDEQYAAPGGVVRDPTLGSGNLIMFYEAEIHCPHSPQAMAAGWVSVGVARSDDGGRSWPLPVAQPGHENDWLEYGEGRYAGVTLPGMRPTTRLDRFDGDSLPSAFVDDMDPSGEYYVYVPYTFTGSPTTKPDAFIHMARAKLGDTAGHRVEGRLQFQKWHVDSRGNGGWSQPGRGGLESPVMTSSCVSGPMAENHAQIVYNEALGVYMMTFSCMKLNCVTAQQCTPVSLSWYHSTATSLKAQEWSTPRLVLNSTRPTTATSPGHYLIDGGYTSFMTPGCEPGHIGMTGNVLFLQGDPLGPRKMAARTFTIDAGMRALRPACGAETTHRRFR